MSDINWIVIEGRDPETKRMEVPGGWLYLVAHAYYVDSDGHRTGYWVNGWHAPVFVQVVR